MSTTPMNALSELWSRTGADPSALARVTLTGADPVLPSSFAVGTLAQASIAAAGLAASELHRLRTGIAQAVAVDMRHAAVEFRSERYFRTDAPPADPWDKIAGLYRTKDGGWIRLHTNFPHHRDGILKLLGTRLAIRAAQQGATESCAYDRDAVQQALLQWDGEAFETAAAEANMVVTKTRSLAEWAAHPQGEAVAQLPVLEIVKVADSPPRPLPAADRPLSGVRVLELTRIIAGPVAGRTLAAHGADVLHITSPNLPSIPSLVIDTGRGKRNAFLDLDTAVGRDQLAKLTASADVFIQGYRPGGLAARGFDPLELARRNPSLIAVSLSAYGHVGPWSNRRGFDSLTQNANGINVAEAHAASLDARSGRLPEGESERASKDSSEAARQGGAATGKMDRPKELPAQALDHAAGYLLAFGAMIALHRRATEGGSWLVRTSLAQVGEWLKSLGRIDGGHTAPDPKPDDIADLIETSDSGFGPLRAVRHAAILSATPARWVLPSMPLGHGKPEWL